MVFKSDRKKAAANDLLPAGEYEMYVRNLSYDVTQSGTERLSLSFMVRDDVEQEGAGRIMYDSLWLSERAMPITERQLNRLCTACEIDDGREYASWDLLGLDLAGRFVRVRVGVSKAQNGYEPRNQAINFEKTKYPEPLGEIKGLSELKAKPKPPAFNQAGGFTQVGDDDLPF